MDVRDADALGGQHGRELARLAHDHVGQPASASSSSFGSAERANSPAKTSSNDDLAPARAGRGGAHPRPGVGHPRLVGLVERRRTAARRAGRAGRSRAPRRPGPRARRRGRRARTAPAGRRARRRAWWRRGCAYRGETAPRRATFPRRTPADPLELEEQREQRADDPGPEEDQEDHDPGRHPALGRARSRARRTRSRRGWRRRARCPSASCRGRRRRWRNPRRTGSPVRDSWGIGCDQASRTGCPRIRRIGTEQSSSERRTQ